MHEFERAHNHNLMWCNKYEVKSVVTFTKTSGIDFTG